MKQQYPRMKFAPEKSLNKFGKMNLDVREFVGLGETPRDLQA